MSEKRIIVNTEKTHSTRMIASNSTILLPVLAVLLIRTAISTSSEEYSSQYSSNAEPSLRQLLIQRVLAPNSVDDNLSKIREAGLKRGTDLIPSGFLGVRGKKTEKAKVKDPFPGFLGVRGKKSFHSESSFHKSTRRTDDIVPKVVRYFQKRYFKLKSNSNI